MLGGTPAPRNNSPASTRIDEAHTYVPCTVSGATVLGRMWRRKILPVRAPPAIAASTNGSSRTPSTIDRTNRASRESRHQDRQDHDGTPPWNNDTMAIASRIDGIAITPSIRASARHPPAGRIRHDNPITSPRQRHHRNDNPTNSEIRAPYTVRATSRPRFRCRPVQRTWRLQPVDAVHRQRIAGDSGAAAARITIDAMTPPQ